MSSFWGAPEPSRQQGSTPRGGGSRLKRALQTFFGATHVSVYEVAGEAHVPAAELSGEAAAARQRAAKGKGKVGEEPGPSLAHASGDSAWSLEQQQPWSPEGQQQQQQQQATVERLGRLAVAVLAAGTPSLSEALEAAAGGTAGASAAAGNSSTSPGSSSHGTAVELASMSPWSSGSSSGPGSSSSRPAGSSGSDTSAWAAAAGPSGSGSWQASAGPSGSGSRYSDRV